MDFAKATKGDKSYIVQDNHDATFTHWQYSTWGMIGNTGEPTPDVTISPIRTKTDFARVAVLELQIERANRSQKALFTVMKVTKSRED